MKIVYATTYPPIHCGVGEYTRMLIAGLKSIDPGIQVYVFANIETGAEPWYDGFSGAYVYPSFKRGSSDYSGLIDFLTSIGGADIIHVQHEYGIFGYSDSILSTAVECRQERLVGKIVFTMHTVYHPLAGATDAIKFQEALNQCDAIVVHSHLQEFELRNQGLSQNKIARIPHGTLLNPYLGYPRYKLAYDLGIDEEKLHGLIIAFPGFLRIDKGLDILVGSLKILQNSGENMTIIIAGEIKHKEVLSDLESVGELTNLIFWERYLSNDEILKLEALADTIILPYNDPLAKYSVSGILHLSMGSLKPIIGTRVPRLIELYQYAPRLTVPPKNSRLLAKLIRWVSKNYDLSVAYMSYIYSYAVRAQWHRIARKHLTLYHRLLRTPH